MTMIRINLLPVRQAQKRELGRQFLVLAAIVLVGALGGNYYWYSVRHDAAEREARDVRDIQARIAALEKEIGEVNELKAKSAEVSAKLAALATLQAGRKGPVKMLDAVTMAIPKKVWVSDFNEVGGAVRIVGSALTLDDVSDFMKGLAAVVWTPKGMGRILERIPNAGRTRVEITGPDGISVEEIDDVDVKNFFTNVELKSTSQPTSGTGTRVVSFELATGANYAI